VKVLVLTKRQYTNKDLIDDQYGRLWEIPLALLKNGHNIKGVCLSYRRCRNYGFVLTTNDLTLNWVSFNLIPSFLSYIYFLRSQFKSSKPDIIWASSDTFHVILGFLLGKIYHVPCVVDLYDNYEAYKLSKVTGIIPFFRLVVKSADAVSVVSEPLIELVNTSYKAKGKLIVIENAVNSDLFYPQPKKTSREKFKLPENAKIIGTAGALDEGRGIDVLYTAFDSLAKDIPDLYLAVAGSGSREHPIFRHPNARDLGLLSNSQVAVFLNTLDVAVICNKDSDFGRYCFPQKAHEILACGVPLVAANVGVMSELLKNNPECLYDPKNPLDLANKIATQLKTPATLKIPINTWAKQAKKLESFMERTIATFGL
jgi:teichuronic acid biosynthesis glycosyltransferase TuaC